VASLLDKTLQEEEETDRQLTDIAESYINFQAEEEDERSSEPKTESMSMTGTSF
jgi:hypothetical protein